MEQLSNKQISGMFDLLAKLMTIADENPFRIRSYSNVAFSIGKLDRPLLKMSDAEIKKVGHIGPGIFTLIQELQTTGQLQILEEYISATPPGILEMLQIKGLGAKKVRQLWLDLEIESIGELAQACQENRLLSLKGFGQKTQDNIYKSILYMQASKGKFLLAQVWDRVEEMEVLLYQAFPQNSFYLVGDIKRQMNIVERVEWVSDLDTKDWEIFFENLLEAQLSEHEDYIQFEAAEFPIIRIYPLQKTGVGLQLLRHNAASDFFKAMQTKFQLPKDAATEEAVFETLNIHYIHPARREINNFQTLVEKNKSIPLIEEQEIKGLIHCHSHWSDGSNSIQEMAMACIDQGLEYMLMTDHSVSAFYARGLEADRIIAQHQEIDQLNQELSPFRIFKGIEADIQYSGDLDYNETIWKSFDVIIASVHSQLRMTAEKANERILKALDNPYIKILGHATGRLLLSREAYPVDMYAVIDKCAQNHIAIELNANPRRLDLDWSLINYALEKGVYISINPDAHSIKGIQDIRYGVLSAQKSLLTAKQNISSFSLEEFKSYFKLV